MRAFFESLAPGAPLNRHGRRLIWALAALFVVFFGATLDREVFQHTRKGDLGVYLRAAWAAHAGTSLYQITDDHGWHYLYPPLLASLLIPLADPPADAPEAAKAGAMPYWLSATIWYWIGIACLLASVHLVASALEDTGAARGAPPPGRYSQGWWALRLLPLVSVMFFAGDALGRGQTTPILLLCLSGSGAALLRGRSIRAGAWLGFAAALKLFPAFLLIYPLWRRDKRFLAAAAAVIVAGLLLPFAIMGPSAGSSAYREFIGERLLGEASGAGNPELAGELHGTNSRIQSFEYMIYDTLHPDRTTRVAQPPVEYFLAHIALSALLTAGALWAMRRRADALGEFLFFAALVQLMVPILPVSRPHYYAFGSLILAGLYAAEWPRRRGIWGGWPLALATTVFVGASILDAIDQHHALEFGVATYGALALAGLGLIAARRPTAGQPEPVFTP